MHARALTAATTDTLAPFAQIEQMVDAAVLGQLANALAMIGERTVPVLFDEKPVTPFDGEADALASSCEGAAADLCDLGRGARIVIRGLTYQVLESGTAEGGLWRLRLGGV